MDYDEVDQVTHFAPPRRRPPSCPNHPRPLTTKLQNYMLQFLKGVALARACQNTTPLPPMTTTEPEASASNPKSAVTLPPLVSSARAQLRKCST